MFPLTLNFVLHLSVCLVKLLVIITLLLILPNNKLLLTLNAMALYKIIMGKDILISINLKLYVFLAVFSFKNAALVVNELNICYIQDFVWY